MNTDFCPRLIMLGVGQVASQVAALGSQYKLIGSTRNAGKKQRLESLGIIPFLIQPDFPDQQRMELSDQLIGAKVLISFPPDGHSDHLFASLCNSAETIIYISSTSVYGPYSGVVNESTQVDLQDEKSKLRLQAEKIWLDRGAIILRAPGLYGPESGLHLRLANGSYRLPPNNNNYISRIHVQDLARIILAIFAKRLPAGSIYLVGDLEPARQIEVVRWLCQKMNLPLPDICAPEAVPQTLTANRRVNPSRILAALNMELQFPTYKEGYADLIRP